MQITFSTNVYTGPLLSGNSFNDTTDAATFSTTAGGTFVWATHLTTEALTADGSGGWTGNLLESGTDTVATSGETTITATYTATTGTGGESRKFSYYVRDAAGNDSNVITESFVVNSSYAENYVDNNGTAWMYALSGEFVDNTKAEWAFRFIPQDTTLNHRLYESSRSYIRTYTGGRLQIQIKDSANVIIFSLLTPSGTPYFTNGVEAFVYVSADSATGTYVVAVDGVTVPGGTITGTANPIDLTVGTGFLANEAGGGIGDYHISEMFMGAGYNTGSSVMWNGGLKANLATLAGYTPLVYFGNGQAATAWDAYTNLGTITLGAGATGFTEV